MQARARGNAAAGDSTAAHGNAAATGIRAHVAHGGIALVVLAVAMGGFAIAGDADDGNRDASRSALAVATDTDGAADGGGASTVTADDANGGTDHAHDASVDHPHDTAADPATHPHDGSSGTSHAHGGEHATHADDAHPAGEHAGSHTDGGAPHAAGTAPHDHGTSSGGGPTPTTAHGGHAHGTGTTTPTSSGATTPTTHGGHAHGPTTTLPPGATTTTVAGATTTTTVHHHDGPNVQLADLPVGVQSEIDRITTWAMQYDTTAKATAAGYPQLTLYFPGIAAHYVDTDRLFDGRPFDVDSVEVLLFNGTGPDADLVGINYIVQSGAQPPEGFAGDFDVWHEHPTLCLNAELIVVSEVPRGETCGRRLTTFPFDGFWLLHVWSIPGWESPEGIFSHENSRV